MTSIIVYCIFLLLFLLLTYISAIKGLPIWVFCMGLYLIVLFSLLLGSSINQYTHRVIPKPASQICEQNSVSYVLCQTIAEYTGESESDIAYFLKYCGKSEMELKDAIAIIDPELSETEIISILVWADKRQQENDSILNGGN